MTRVVAVLALATLGCVPSNAQQVLGFKLLPTQITALQTAAQKLLSDERVKSKPEAKAILEGAWERLKGLNADTDEAKVRFREASAAYTALAKALSLQTKATVTSAPKAGHLVRYQLMGDRDSAMPAPTAKGITNNATFTGPRGFYYIWCVDSKGAKLSDETTLFELLEAQSTVMIELFKP